MIAWLAYTIAVTLLLCGAALAAEAAARMRRASTRWTWAAAIVAAPLLPFVISTVSIQLPAQLAPAAARAPVALRDTTSPVLAPSDWVAARLVPAAQPAGAGVGTADRRLERAWIAASLAMLFALVSSAIALQVRKRRWTRRRLCGADVLVGPDAGPAVVGRLRTRIVVPAWLVAAPPLQQSLVVAHEQPHVDARDPQLLALAVGVLALMPWKLPLWWLVRRLRHAIEVECDARVLRGGHDVLAYGATLVDVGQRQSGYIGAGAAMAESRSLLEQRPRPMLRNPARKGGALALLLGGALALLLGGAALSMVAVAAHLSPPPAG